MTPPPSGGRGPSRRAVLLSTGLTGGIASGKSTVLRLLGTLGCETHDADSIVASLYRPGEAGHRALLEVYGDRILLASGEVDRKTLAEIAFSSATEARRLNDLIHPLVIGEQARLLERASRHPPDRIWVVEATLLLESGGRARFDRIVVVDVPEAVQIERAARRGLSRAEAERRIRHQLPREERLRQADYVIDNAGDEAALALETARVHDQLLADLEVRRAAAGDER